ncbi:MAG: peptide chain release factor-like protein, partial [bacterium]
FWDDKIRAQAILKEIADLKEEQAGHGKYDKGDAILSVISGAGGIDAEDFAQILFSMYVKYFEKKGWVYKVIHSNENDHGGFRNIVVEVSGKNAYGNLKNESGVHRLVRISPFNAKQLRHTSFALVEVIPKFEKKDTEIEIRPEDVRVEFARSSGPGGQNVNKRETAVRIVHIATNIAVHCDAERSQAQNREKAMEILKAKLYILEEDRKKKKAEGLSFSKDAEIEWGSQIRSYVLHPYKMVKDHRTNVETAKVDDVLDGEIDEFVEAERSL